MWPIFAINETITLRVSPQRKYQIEIIARSQQRSITSCAEWALDYAFANAPHLPDLEKVWAVHEADRLIKLWIEYPHLLSYDEQLIINFVQRVEYTVRPFPVFMPLINTFADHAQLEKGEKARWYPCDRACHTLLHRTWDMIKSHVVEGAPWDVECLRHMLTKAVEWGAIDRNPLIGQLRLENPKPRSHLPQEWEIREALKHAPPLLSCYIRFKLVTGLRRGDILRLTMDNVRDDGVHVQPHKTAHSSGKTLTIEWDDTGELRALVDEILALPPTPRIKSAPLFVTRQGKSFVREDGRANGFDALWGRFMTRLVANTDATRFQERDLRAVVASESATLQEASDRLGHSDTAITKRVYRRKPIRVKPLLRE